jgi:hypothetical protein
MHIHNQLVNIVYEIEVQTDKLNDVIVKIFQFQHIYPIRIKILEQKKYLNILYKH